MSKKKQVVRRSYKKPGPAARRFPVWAVAAALGAVLLVTLILFTAMMKLEETDTFCGSCHTQPETTYLERMAAAPLDLASAHHSRQDPAQNAHCIDCHAGPGLTGRAQAILEGAGNAGRYVTRTLTQPGKMPTAFPDANCLKCHADLIQAESYNGKDNHFHYFLARWKAAIPGDAAYCAECHKGHNLKGEAGLGYLEPAPAEAVCTRCHTTFGRDE